MEIEECADPARFAAEVFPFLQEHEAEHNLLMGILGQNRDAQGGQALYCALARRGGQVACVAVRSPGRPAVLSRGWESDALSGLVASLRTRPERLGGVIAPDGAGGLFAAAWEAATGARAEVRVHDRIYVLERVRAVARPPGSMHPAVDSDRPVLYGWIDAFSRETTGRSDPALSRRLVDGRVPPGRSSGYHVWRLGSRPVAVAGHSGRTPNGIRVAPVYTPPDERRRGYATALVADLSQLLLDAGHRRCFLFADRDNPTTNDIYQQIGYRAVADATEYRFIEPAAGN